MKTFIADIIPKIQRFSQKLDETTLLMNQHWVVIEEIENSKNVFIFRSNQQLIISQNGNVEKATWEYLGNNSLLIDRKNESLLFKHGFLDEHILALKVDSREEYAILVNENKLGQEINSLEEASAFLSNKYLIGKGYASITNTKENSDSNRAFRLPQPSLITYTTNKGEIQIEKAFADQHVNPEMRVFQYGVPAKNGKYQLDFMWYIHVAEGAITKITIF